jgi:beta-N-acetylhexosaminidase
MYDFSMENITKKMLCQMFIIGLDGDKLNENKNLINSLNEGLGGVIFFTQNIQSDEKFKKLICEIKNEALIKPFLAIDQEGGRVERTENIHNGKKYLSPKMVYQKGLEQLKKQTVAISEELNSYGINLNFAPCIDVNTNPNNPIIGERAFSNKPEEVIEAGELVVKTYLENGIIPCVKHFPGHGDAGVDSHKALPVIDLSLGNYEENHIRPFREVKSPMLMVAHLHCKCFDEATIPASLSENVIKHYLIEKMKYEGLIITDDMIMGGVQAYGAVNACKMAINAGVNILLYRDCYDSTIEIIDKLYNEALQDENLSLNIKKSYEKIMSCKKRFLG